jgi:hypothetical protein
MGGELLFGAVFVTSNVLLAIVSGTWWSLPLAIVCGLTLSAGCRRAALVSPRTSKIEESAK